MDRRQGEASTAPPPLHSTERAVEKSSEERKRPRKRRASGREGIQFQFQFQPHVLPSPLPCPAPLCFTFHSIPYHFAAPPSVLAAPSCFHPRQRQGQEETTVATGALHRRMSDRELRPLRSISTFQTPSVSFNFLLVAIGDRKAGMLIPCSF